MTENEVEPEIQGVGEYARVPLALKLKFGFTKGISSIQSSFLDRIDIKEPSELSQRELSRMEYDFVLLGAECGCCQWHEVEQDKFNSCNRVQLCEIHAKEPEFNYVSSRSWVPYLDFNSRSKQSLKPNSTHPLSTVLKEGEQAHKVERGVLILQVDQLNLTSLVDLLPVNHRPLRPVTYKATNKHCIRFTIAKYGTTNYIFVVGSLEDMKTFWTAIANTLYNRKQRLRGQK